jgi:hypothetical protein
MAACSDIIRVCFTAGRIEPWRDIGCDDLLEGSALGRMVLHHGKKALDLVRTGVEPAIGEDQGNNSDAHALIDKSRTRLQEPKGPRTVCANSTIEFP